MYETKQAYKLKTLNLTTGEKIVEYFATRDDAFKKGCETCTASDKIFEIDKCNLIVIKI